MDGPLEPCVAVRRVHMAMERAGLQARQPLQPSISVRKRRMNQKTTEAGENAPQVACDRKPMARRSFAHCIVPGQLAQPGAAWHDLALPGRSSGQGQPRFLAREDQPDWEVATESTNPGKSWLTRSSPPRDPKRDPSGVGLNSAHLSSCCRVPDPNHRRLLCSVCSHQFSASSSFRDCSEI